MSIFSFPRNLQRHRNDLSISTVLLFFTLLTYIPFLFVLINSFKDNSQFFKQFWLPTLPVHLENYTRAWAPISRNIINSVIYSVPTLLLVLSISGLAGYGFARFRFIGKEALFFLVIVLLMLPSILLLVPLSIQVKQMGMLGTAQGIVLPWTAMEIVFGTFLMRTFFETLPKDYFEAARLDGAAEFTLFIRVAVPLALPAFSTLGILNLLFTWNDLLWPMIVLSEPARFPVAAGVLTFTGTFSTDYGPLFAGYVIASIPLLVLFTLSMRRFMRGLQGGIGV